MDTPSGQVAARDSAHFVLPGRGWWQRHEHPLRSVVLLLAGALAVLVGLAGAVQRVDEFQQLDFSSVRIESGFMIVGVTPRSGAARAGLAWGDTITAIDGVAAAQVEDLERALFERRVSLLSSERSRGVKFSIAKGSLKLFSSNPEIGEARDDLDVEYKGPELEVGFNSQYLLDFLLSIRSERIRLDLKDENSAAIMKPDLDEDIRYTYVLMPMKI